jgi:hypothetical protein
MKRLACLLIIGTLVTACSSSSPTAPAPVIPNVQGHWSGSTTNQNCTAIGDFQTANACAGFTSTSGFDLILTQTGSTVSGSLTIGTFPITVSGPVSTSGVVSLTGRGSTSGIIIDLTNWNTQVSGTIMSGTFGFIITAPGQAVGNISIRAALVNVVKVG